MQCGISLCLKTGLVVPLPWPVSESDPLSTISIFHTHTHTRTRTHGLSLFLSLSLSLWRQVPSTQEATLAAPLINMWTPLSFSWDPKVQRLKMLQALENVIYCLLLLRRPFPKQPEIQILPFKVATYRRTLSKQMYESIYIVQGGEHPQTPTTAILV